ncbi:hypothetical protein KUTeg_015697, partial [Tegillarca granosa]
MITYCNSSTKLITRLMLTMNSKRVKSKSAAGAEIRFDQETLRDPRLIVDGWGKYFQNLYCVQDDPGFDDNHRRLVEWAVLNHLPNGKASGLDSVTYEHIKFASSVTHNCLLNLYNAF